MEILRLVLNVQARRHVLRKNEDKTRQPQLTRLLFFNYEAPIVSKLYSPPPSIHNEQWTHDFLLSDAETSFKYQMIWLLTRVEDLKLLVEGDHTRGDAKVVSLHPLLANLTLNWIEGWCKEWNRRLEKELRMTGPISFPLSQSRFFTLMKLVHQMWTNHKKYVVGDGKGGWQEK